MKNEISCTPSKKPINLLSTSQIMKKCPLQRRFVKLVFYLVTKSTDMKGHRENAKSEINCTLTNVMKGQTFLQCQNVNIE